MEEASTSATAGAVDCDFPDCTVSFAVAVLVYAVRRATHAGGATHYNLAPAFPSTATVAVPQATTLLPP